jgi:FtsP/CotA-like multicopper oxidase with cupredoxin domain
VQLVNQLPVPTSIHWHGLILPDSMDGVPFVAQEPIPPGGTYKYDFPLKQSGTQEVRLEAEEPLTERPVQRSLPSVLGGNMSSYTWTINGAAYPNRSCLDVKEGERVELVITNETGMSHPMHLHGHVFEVADIDGQKIAGAKRDTILVPPKSTIKIVFDADNPGVWAYHCHILYHLAAGMFTVLKYDGANTEQWQPDKTKTELENPLELGSADAIWREMTDGLLASSKPTLKAVGMPSTATMPATSQ